MKNTVKSFVDELGITPYRFWQDTGISRVTAYKLYNDSDYIPGADVLVKICDTYQIQPGKILVWFSTQETQEFNQIEQPCSGEDLKSTTDLKASSNPPGTSPQNQFLALPEFLESA